MLFLALAVLAGPCTARAETPVAGQGAAAAATRGSIVGPTMRSTDLARSSRFFTEGLGMTLAGRLDLPNVTKLMFAFGPQRRPPVLMLVKRKGAAAAAPVVHGDGYGPTVLDVADAEAVALRLKVAGYAPGKLNINPQTGFRGFMVKDPDGHEFEVTQRPAATSGSE
jgi:catechol 2,3-dioxygenase-like lactoylglutathione lyase family enzyme